MVRCFLVQGVPQKPAQGQRIGGAPGDRAFGVQTLKIPGEQRTKIYARGQTRPTIPTLLVELPAQRLDFPIEVVFLQNLVQSVVKGMARRLDHGTGGYPEVLLSLALLTRSHCHVLETFKTFLR